MIRQLLAWRTKVHFYKSDLQKRVIVVQLLFIVSLCIIIGCVFRFANTRTLYIYGENADDLVARSIKVSLQRSLPSDRIKFKLFFFNIEEQRDFIKRHRCGVERFNELVNRKQHHIATELFKYCTLSSHRGRALFLDLSNPVVVRLQDTFNVHYPSSIAVLGHYQHYGDSIHGSFLYLQRKHVYIAKEVLRIVLSSSLKVLEENPLHLSRILHKYISTNLKKYNLNFQSGIDSNEWTLLKQECFIGPFSPASGLPTQPYSIQQCPAKTEFCCSVLDTAIHQVIMYNRHPLIPPQMVMNKPTLPLHSEVGFYGQDELPYISTIAVKEYKRPLNWHLNENLYDILKKEDQLPQTNCTRCLHAKSCKDFETVCESYLNVVCTLEAPKKFISKDVVLTLPLYRRDPTRLIPRIVHQTWYEALTEKEYPNMSRLVESFRNSGWEYKFYTDKQAVDFLKTHFPPEVLEAYHALIPGAFKADLFRYCALLIYGGVYADVDILLESKLDVVIEPDVGFMVPLDEPDACVWQGFIAAAPGHPFLIKAVETVVNQVRSRFTSIDIDASFCPTPNYKVLHMFDVLFTAGPCLLGASINRVLGRHGQTLLTPGELFSHDEKENTKFVTPIINGRKRNRGTSKKDSTSKMSMIPGRTVLLKQNKWDMAAHRFTSVDLNLIVAATDLQDSDDRLNMKNELTAVVDKRKDVSGVPQEEHDEDEEEFADLRETKDEDKREMKNALQDMTKRIKVKVKDNQESSILLSTSTEGIKDDSEQQKPADDFEKVDEESEEYEESESESSSSDGATGKDHYSKAHAKRSIYGLENLYVNQERSTDNIRILLER